MRLISYFVKAKRAQSVDDYETWVGGGVVPTLNRMDNNGESFATVLVLIEEGKPVIMRNREGCAGGGKGPMYSDKSFTLATSNDQILIVDGTRVNDVRVYEDEIAPTVISRYGTGGGNVPMIFEPKSAFEENWAETEVKNTLRANASKSSHVVIYPIQDGRDMDKKQNGLGVGDENDPAYTVDTVSRQAVAYDEYNDSVSDTHHTLRAGTKQSTGVLTSTVRRLTPMECERLQGFPDGWTDGQADSHRYKQMGNAVAVPVVEWIVGRLVGAINDADV